MSFLFVWQLLVSSPLSIPSGCIGIARYAGYLLPTLDHPFADHTLSAIFPLLGKFEMRLLITGGTFVAMGSCVLAVVLLYRPIAILAPMSKYLWVGVMATVALVLAPRPPPFPPPPPST